MTGVTNLSLGDSSDGRAAVKFDFLLPQTHPNRSSHRIQQQDQQQMSSSSSLSPNHPVAQYTDCQRHGVMTAFEGVEEFKRNFPDVLELFDDSPPNSPYDSENR